MPYDSAVDLPLLALVTDALHDASALAPCPGRILVARLGLANDVALRRVVNELRRCRVPVLSCPTGYWLSRDQDEISACVADLEHRVQGMLGAINGLRRALP
jgi:hypothetical protein